MKRSLKKDKCVVTVMTSCLLLLSWRRIGILLVLMTMCNAPIAYANLVVEDTARQGAFTLAEQGHAAAIYYDKNDFKVVVHAASDLAKDIQTVTGAVPQVIASTEIGKDKQAVIIGTLGHNRIIDQLANSGKLDVAALRGKWESFIIATVANPRPGLDAAMVIVGSDRRGTAYGVYEVSEAIGVSPWQWWADVPVKHRNALFVPAGQNRFGPPTVKYRGIFINDEDWGLHPWASRTFEPEAGGIGPRTYQRIFELLLRLKANMLWPAMHKVSVPFNQNPRNAQQADEYAIIMGSSHAEPMLRNNVGEWHDAPERFNYAQNRQGVRKYWETRVRSARHYESIWTLGMRGIHDSGLMGASSQQGQVALLRQVIADQRAMLKQYVNPDLTQIPQIFVPYKEVLDLYRAGLDIPDDVTLVWPDDNFGYIRHFPDAKERQRKGGSGVYYHLSYLGAPLSYIWLSTTPPALIEEEMTRAWDAGVQQLWVANVGDLKPAEITTSFFLEQAWDINRWRNKPQRAFLTDWWTRNFGPQNAAQAGQILDDYYRLNFVRRPEHLQWWLPGQVPDWSAMNWSPFSEAQVDDRLAQFNQLTAAVDALMVKIPAAQRDAVYELLEYPVRAAAAANQRYFQAQRYARLIDTHPVEAREAGRLANDADQQIKQLTQRYNEQTAAGKWRYLMAEEPADNQWPQFRISPLALPAASLTSEETKTTRKPSGRDVPADAGVRVIPWQTVSADWKLIQGLGHDQTQVSTRAGATLSYAFNTPAGTHGLRLVLLPTFATADNAYLHLRVTIDGKNQNLNIPRQTGDNAWAQGVLNNRLDVLVAERLVPGEHHVTVTTLDEGIAIMALEIVPQKKV